MSYEHFSAMPPLEPCRLRSKRNQEFDMDEDIASLREEVKSATALVEQRNGEIAKLKRELERALMEADSARQKVQQLEERQELEKLARATEVQGNRSAA